jgi:hypothetical protein
VLTSFGNAFLLPGLLLLSLAGSSLGQSDLAKLINLIDQEKPSSLSQIKQLREKNSKNRQLTALFDFGYGLSAIKFGRPQESIESLKTFVDQRPEVFQARLLLIRAHLDLEQFDNAVYQAEKLLVNFPAQADSAQQVARVTGTLVGFLNFARPECSDELKRRLEESAESKIPESFISAYRKSIALVESRVATINDEIKRATEKADADVESKVSENLSNAEKLRQQAEKDAEALQQREKLRAAKFEEIRSNLQKMEQDHSALTASQVARRNQVDNYERQRQALVREDTKVDKQGNKTTSIRIIDYGRYNDLGTKIAGSKAEISLLESRKTVLLNNYQQLRGQAAGLLSQQQMDELFSKDMMMQHRKAANIKEKKAQQDLGRKGKPVPATRALSARLKHYSTYEPLDIASNSDYLRNAAKKIETAH